MVWRGVAGRGVAWLGVALRGWSWHDVLGCGVALLGGACGAGWSVAGRGGARLGIA
jgi:hypothetical protein